MISLVLHAAVAGFAVLTIAAALSDIATMTIPNRIPAALVLTFAVAALAVPLDPVAAALHMGTGLIVLVATAGLFALGLFGGGDAKLMPAVALWTGPAATLDFVFHTALAGGLLALAFLLARRLPLGASVEGRAWLGRLMATDGGIPYGIAIAYGALAAAAKSPLVAPVLA